MSTENIDDLFRRQLGGHETPAGDDLWARLQAGPAAAASPPEPPAAASERVDQLFQRQLIAHATPPGRQVWERLEDEHLRPRKRRAAAWWPLAMAAAVALLLLAGGAGLWLGFPGGTGSAGTVGSESANKRGENGQPNAGRQLHSPGTIVPSAGSPAPNPPALAAGVASKVTEGIARPATLGRNVAQASAISISGLNQKNPAARATRAPGPASSASKVGMMAQQSSRRPPGASRQPDAAAASAPLVARSAAPRPTSTPPADEPAAASAIVVANLPAATPTPAGGIAPAATSSPANQAAALAATNLITVDVRSGEARRPSLAAAVATAAAATQERQGRGGRLLRQVGHAVRGERISLSEVTGLPENLTLEANIGRRRVSKSIQL